MMRVYIVNLRTQLRRHWVIYGMLFLIWILMVDRLFVHHMPRLPVLFNLTPSLPYKIAVVDYRRHVYQRGDYVIYAVDGPVGKLFEGFQGQPFFKIVRGVPGDKITVEGRRVLINGEYVGTVARHMKFKIQLEPIEDGLIPPGYFYMQGTGEGSFDSRYSIIGLVKSDRIAAAVIPIL